MLSVFTAAVTPEDPAANIVSLVVTSAVSATVLSSLVLGLVNYLLGRRNARISERKNAVDSESDIIARYKEAAAEERAQKESAVRMTRDLLNDSKEQATVLKNTVDTLTGTITMLKEIASTQQDMITQLTEDRDRTKAALERAEERIRTQEAELSARLQEILERSRSMEEAQRIVRETFGSAVDDVD